MKCATKPFTFAGNMAIIRLETEIKASAQTCFDLSRSVDAHLSSMEHTKERAVGGRTSGLCRLNDVITWEAKHLGVKQYLTVKITKMEPYVMFEDVMVKGAFKSMQHQHHFEEKNGTTTMRDVFAYETPGWIFGKFFDWLVLERYMTKLLRERNEALKRMAEKTE